MTVLVRVVIDVIEMAVMLVVVLWVVFAVAQVVEELLVEPGVLLLHLVV